MSYIKGMPPSANKYFPKLERIQFFATKFQEWLFPFYMHIKETMQTAPTQFMDDFKNVKAQTAMKRCMESDPVKAQKIVLNNCRKSIATTISGFITSKFVDMEHSDEIDTLIIQVAMNLIIGKTDEQIQAAANAAFSPDGSKYEKAPISIFEKLLLHT